MLSFQHPFLCEEKIGRKVESVYFGIRPEHIKVAKEPTEGSFKIKVRISELLGSEYHLHFLLNEKDIIAKVYSEDEIYHGDELEIVIERKKIHLFDKETEELIF